MSIEANKALTRSWFAALNAKNLNVVGEHFAPNFVHHTPGEVEPEGLEQLTRFLGAFNTAFPDDIHHVIQDLIAEGDRVVVRWRATGTNTGPLFGKPPTGKPFSVTGINIYRVADGRFVEQWSEYDQKPLARLQAS